LKSMGVRNAIVDAGGDLMTMGSKNSKPWSVGIQHPREKNKLIGVCKPHRSMAIVTSGDYERFFIVDGKRYCHIIDCRTGKPADRYQSVTVAASSCGIADAMSTAIFVADPSKIEKILAVDPSASAMTIAADGAMAFYGDFKEKTQFSLLTSQ
jgi:FAD:protein FMN transferase